jgi:hypothetical protein
MFSAVNMGNIVLQRHYWFSGSCLLLACSLVSCLPVVVVLVFLLVLLQFARLGFCNRDWNWPSVVPHRRVGFDVVFSLLCYLQFAGETFHCWDA